MFEGPQVISRDIVARHEAKYLVPREIIPEVRAFISTFCVPDPYAHGSPPEYSITTLQLDDAGYSLHHAKERDLLNRFKLRVRTYGEIGSAPIFTEIKAKYSTMIHKWRAHIPFDRWDRDLIFSVSLPSVFRSRGQEADFLQFKRLVHELGAQPVVLIRYLRESYVARVDRYARVTFDRRLQYQMTDSWTDFGRSGRWRSMDSVEAQNMGLPYSAVILELKTLAEPPLWAMDLVERFELKRSGFCKFSTALWREGLFRRWPDMGSYTAHELALV